MSDIRREKPRKGHAGMLQKVIAPALVDRKDADEYKGKSPTFWLGVPALSLKQILILGAGARRR
jgi:hypothetical protein